MIAAPIRKQASTARLEIGASRRLDAAKRRRFSGKGRNCPAAQAASRAALGDRGSHAIHLFQPPASAHPSLSLSNSFLLEMKSGKEHTGSRESRPMAAAGLFGRIKDVDANAAQPTGFGSVGLCARCAQARIIHSDRGSTFYRCGVSATDPRFPKYPTLPVESCQGFEPEHASVPSSFPRGAEA